MAGLSELGAYLQRHREEQGLGLEEIEEITRIRRRYLVAMEAGDWEALPPGVYVKGLLKNYARALGVSQASIMRLYAKERPKEARLQEPQLISQPLLNEPRISVETLLALVVIAVALSLGWWMVQEFFLPALEQARLGESAAVTADVGQNGDGDSAADDGAEDEGGNAASGDDAESAAVSASATPRATRSSASPTPRVSPTATPAQGLQLQVRTVQGNVWLRITADGTMVFEGFLREGENDSWEGEADGIFRLRTGRPGATEVTINGQVLDDLDNDGEPRTLEWRLLPNGDIEQSG